MMNESEVREILKLFDQRLAKLESVLAEMQSKNEVSNEEPIIPNPNNLLRYTKEELKVLRKGIPGLKVPPAPTPKTPRKEFWARGSSSSFSPSGSWFSPPNSTTSSPASSPKAWGKERNLDSPRKFEAKMWKIGGSSIKVEEETKDNLTKKSQTIFQFPETESFELPEHPVEKLRSMISSIFDVREEEEEKAKAEGENKELI